MQALSGNQRPDLLTSLMSMSLVLRLPRDMHLCRFLKCPTPAIAFGNATKPSFHKVHNPLRLTTSERPKVLRTRQFLIHLTWKCASRHNGVHFFDMSTFKSGPTLRCFVHLDFAMCFAPQRRALFRHLNFEKSAPRMVCALYILTSQCASHQNGVQFSISQLARWLRTRFSEPTVRPSGATHHWKNAVNRDFSTFSRTCIFFLLTLSLL